MNAIRCFFLCVISFLYIVLSVFAFLMSLSFEGQIGFRIYSNLHGLVWGMFYSHLPLSVYKHGIRLLQCLSFQSLFARIFSGYFQGIFSDLLTPSFFPRFLSITIPSGCLFLIMNVSSGLDITEYLLYSKIKSNQLISIASSLIVQCQNTDIQLNIK